MSRSEKHPFNRISAVVFGPWGTALFGIIFFGLGISTTSITESDMPGRDGLAILCFAAGAAAIASAMIFRDHISIAHEIMGMVLMIVAITRGASWVIGIINEGSVSSPLSVFSDYTAPWVWAVVFSAGMHLWAYGRRETVIVRSGAHIQRKG